MKELIIKIEQWAEDRNLIEGSTPEKQCLKLMSEFGELSDNLCKGRPTIDDIGDCFVVLTILSKQKGFSIHRALKGEVIDSRNGTLLAFLLSSSFNEIYFKIIDKWEINKIVKASIEYLSALAINQGYTLEQCAEHAYNDIKDRKGKMINGVFVKEGDIAK